MANAEANVAINNSTSDDTDYSGAARSWKTLRRLMEDNVFNCESCGLFFTTAVYCVCGTGIVCQNCFTDNKWQGERLRFFDAALRDLPVVPCTNADAGCKLQVLDEDLEAHLEDCKYRLVNCISLGCSWQSKQDDLANHFKETHPTDVIGEDAAFSLDIAQDSFVKAKLLIKKNAHYFLIVRREMNSNHILYDAFKVETGNTHVVIIRHYSDNIEDYTKHIQTKELNMIDKSCPSNKISLVVLKEISEDRSELFLTVKVKKSKSEELLGCSGCGETMRRPVYQCKGNHSVCASCSSKRLRCPVCQNEIDVETRNGSLEALTSDVKYSCANQPFGCEANLLGDRIDQHELKCVYALHTCPLPNCSYKISNNKLFKQHCKVKHKEVSSGSTMNMSLYFLTTEEPPIKYMYCFDNSLFEVRLVSEITSVKSSIEGGFTKFYFVANSKLFIKLLSNNNCNSSNYLWRIELYCHPPGIPQIPQPRPLIKNVLISKDNKIACWSLSNLEIQMNNAENSMWFEYTLSVVRI